MISPGGSIGNYRILSPLSSDTVSQYYLTENTSMRGTPVALRLWNSITFTAPQERDAFLKEARELITLRHPYIVSILDAGVENEHPYLVYEYIYSSVGTLQERIQRQTPQPFPQPEALNILAQIGQALAYAHQQNILHRQLSPAQVVFNARGEALLGGFGLASIQDILARQHTGPIGMIDPFQAPEQQRGTLHKSKLGDQYALGSIAYALLTGYIPTQPPIAPTQRNSFLPIFIERSILKAMSPQPIERFASVTAFLNAIGALPDEGTVINHADTFPPIAASPPLQPVAQQQVFLPDPYKGATPLPAGEQRMGQVVLNGSGTIAAPPPQWADAPMMPPSPIVPPSMAPRPPINNNLNKGKRIRQLALIALLVVLLLVLAGMGAFAYTLVPASSAIVTLTPGTQRVGNSYAVSLVTGQADATKGQVAAHNIAFSAQPQTKTVPASGKGHQNATAATGILTFSNVGQDSDIAPNQTLTSNSGVQVVTDGEVVIKVGGTATVSAHVATPGAGGNIAAFDVNNNYNVIDNKTQQPLTTVTIQNTAAFTGGQDASDFTFVQQSDLDSVSTPLVSQMTTEAQTGAQQQVKPDEKLVNDLKCTPVVTSDHKVNEHATAVTVQVTVKCVGEAYTDQALQTMAVTLLKADAAQKLGSSYALMGNAITGTPTLGNVDANGTATFNIKADSIWAFQFSDALKQQMARAISGKSVSDGTAILQRFSGVSKASIQTSGFGGAIPANASNIRFNAAPVAGLHP